MASFESLYNKIEYRVKAALIQLEELRRENVELKEELEFMKLQQAELEEQLASADEKMKLLVVTKTILDKKDKTETKQQINDWVREIDNCVKLLSNK